MKPEAYSFDLKRIFLGDLPVAFLGEIVFRTVVIYVYTLVLIRLLGKRGLGQLSPFDFVIVIALGSSVGDPMFYDDVPLLHGMLVITVVVLLQRGVSWLTERSSKAQRFIDSEPRRLVLHGVVDRKNLRDEQLEPDELFAALRVAGVRQLGEVELAYIEPSGAVSVLRREHPVSGRPLIAHSDPDYRSPYRAAQIVAHSDQYACAACGQKVALSAGTPFPKQCTRCECDRWFSAVQDLFADASPRGDDPQKDSAH